VSPPEHPWLEGLRALRILWVLAFLSAGFAAEITAGKMEILNTDQGKITMFEDGVTIRDGSTRINAGRVEFYDQQNRAVIHGGSVSIVTPAASIAAESAEYLIGAKRTYLYRNVVIRREGLVITSPSVILDNASNQAMTDAAVRIVDDRRGIEITGGASSFNLASEDGVIHGSPRLKVNRAGGITVTGDEMQLRSSQRYAQATGNVRLVTGDATLECDTLAYFLDQDSAQAIGAPVLTQKESQVSGEMMSFRFDQGDLKRIEVRGGERVVPKLTRRSSAVQDSGLGARESRAGQRATNSRFGVGDEITGRWIAIEFDSGKLSEISIQGDSSHRPEVHQQDSHATGDSIGFHFAAGEIASVKLMGRTDGTYFTDDGDRIEVSGARSVLRFERGEAVQVEIADVRDGRLYRRGSKSKKQKAESEEPE
jgi:lipopolysaccharide export system protein LptA